MIGTFRTLISFPRSLISFSKAALLLSSLILFGFYFIAYSSEEEYKSNHHLKNDNKHSYLNHLKHLAYERSLHHKSIIDSWDKLNISTAATRDVKICFYNNDASERGVTNSMFDYAHYTDAFFKMKPHIIFPRLIEFESGLQAKSEAVGLGNRISLPRFVKRFPVSFCGEPLTDALFQSLVSSIDTPWYKLCPELSTEALQIGCQILYIQKGGLKSHSPVYPDSFFGKIPTLVHAVFNWEPHGTVYAALSASIKGYSARQNGNILPYIVTPPSQKVIDTTIGLRRKMGIPQEALVVCRHGSSMTFDIWYVKSAIVSLLEKYNHTQLHFLFLDTQMFQHELNILSRHGPINTTAARYFFRGLRTDYTKWTNYDIMEETVFGKIEANTTSTYKSYSFPTSHESESDATPSPQQHHQQQPLPPPQQQQGDGIGRKIDDKWQQVHFIDVTTNDDAKEQFFKTCDIMLHARSDGETFGLAVAEMSIRNKPIVTQGRVKRYADMHVKALGDKGYYYNDESGAVTMISKFVDGGIPKGVDFNCYRDYYPSVVMKKFKDMFIDVVMSSVSNTSMMDYQKTIWR